MDGPVLVVGEALTDILTAPDGVSRSTPGGSPANVALGLARLGHPVSLATRVGRDALGRRVREHLRASGVALTEGSVVDAATSTATATLAADGSADYRFEIAWEPPPATVELAATGAAGHLHTGSIAATLAPGAARVEAAVGAARARVTVSYDPNLRPALLGRPEQERPRVERLVAAADVVKASSEDLAWLFPGQKAEAVAARWARGAPRLVVLTLGAEGAVAFWAGGSCRLPAVPTEVVDTVGAGDAFMAGLVSGLLRAGLLGPAGSARARLDEATSTDRPSPAVLAALALASRVAALTCARPGADPPSRATLLS
ncbi:fructokinase [Streptacidiphilus sp. MAP12-33]|uniref:carbohydrate kinase family protein n=1 Tax=Streptacidiphilus sp. MAP12-33 TaxID=3156266 RepID=UPI0035143AFC